MNSAATTLKALNVKQTNLTILVLPHTQQPRTWTTRPTTATVSRTKRLLTLLTLHLWQVEPTWTCTQPRIVLFVQGRGRQ